MFKSNFGPLTEGTATINRCLTLFHFRPEGQRETRNKIVPLNMVKRTVGFESLTSRLQEQRFNSRTIPQLLLLVLTLKKKFF